MPAKPRLVVVEGLANPLPWQSSPPDTDPSSQGAPPPVARTLLDLVQVHPKRRFVQRLSSQAEIDAIKPPQKPLNIPGSPTYDPSKPKQIKEPIVYDPAQNAARITIYPPNSTDTQQLYLKAEVAPGEDALLTQDMKLDENFRRRNADDMNRHKAQQTRGLNQAHWNTDRTFYDAALEANVAAQQAGYAAAQESGFGGTLEEYVASHPEIAWRIYKWVKTFNNQFWCLPPNYTQNEIIQPTLATFYGLANVWARMFLLLRYVCPLADYTGEVLVTSDGLTQKEKWPTGHVFRLSYWIADEYREPIPIVLDALTICPYPEGLKFYAMEWDTGADNVPTDTRRKYGWQRNFFQIANPTDAEVTALLVRPSVAG